MHLKWVLNGVSTGRGLLIRRARKLREVKFTVMFVGLLDIVLSGNFLTDPLIKPK